MTPAAPLARLRSTIPGLDALLGGGFFASAVYIVHGPPGSGKTIFANQLCFGHVAQGRSAVYVTLLAESHARMMQHLRPMRFFDESAIPERLRYISAYAELESHGLDGLLAALRREMADRRTGVLVLDGLVTASDSAGSDRELKKFIHEIQTNAIFHDCTVFLLTSGPAQRVSAEHTMVDGILELEDSLIGVRAQRSITVRKFRGARPLRGKHNFQITDTGLQIFPRIESMFEQAPDAAGAELRLSTGMPSLDAMLAGGYPARSVTVVTGSTGTGKTTLALHFLSRASAAEPGLFFGFYESPERLKLSARACRLDLELLERAGALGFEWHCQGEHLLDELGHRLLDAVSARGVRRLVIDGLGGFFEAAAYPERIGRYIACLVNELRLRGVTVLMTLETRDIVGSVVPTPYGISAIVDNLLFLRFAEVEGGMKRLVSVIKARSTAFDPQVRALEITPQGSYVRGHYTTEGAIIPTAEPIPRFTLQGSGDGSPGS